MFSRKMLVPLVTAAGIATAGLNLIAAPAMAFNTAPHIQASPNPVVETNGGAISFSVLGRNLVPGQTLTESSPELDANCATNNYSGTNVSVGVSGRYNDFDSATGCTPGTYHLLATYNFAPFTTFSTTLQVLPPTTGAAGVTTSPARARLDNSGQASFSVLGSGLAVGTSYNITSPGLNAACGFNNLPQVATADINGNFNVAVVVGASCVPGKYAIFATNTGPGTSYTTHIVLLAP